MRTTMRMTMRTTRATPMLPQGWRATIQTWTRKPWRMRALIKQVGTRTSRIAAASDPVLDDAIPRDLPLRQLRGEMRSTAASQEAPANDPADKNDDENDDENDEGDSNVATGIAGDDPDLDAEAVENACVNQTGWDTDFS